MRQVKFAIGLADRTWKEITVNVYEKENYVLDDDEVLEKAMDIANGIELGNNEIIFRHVLEVDPYDDPLGGVI